MLNYEFPPIGGGAGQAQLNLLRQFAQQPQLWVDVLTCGLGPGLLKEQLSENIDIYKIGIKKRDMHYWRRTEVLIWLFRASRHCQRMVCMNRYDLAHAFFGFPTGWLCYRRAPTLPYVISLRGSDVPGHNARLRADYILLKGLFRRIWSGAEAIVANSTGLQRLASKFMPGLEIAVIPNGIDTDTFRPSEKQFSARPIQVLTVGRLIARKRIDLLIRAVAYAKQRGLEINVNIAGDGNLKGPLVRLAQELGVAHSVHFLGWVPAEQMPELYRSNDLFVMTSLHEGMSNAMLEAMASGLPIVTTYCEGVDELIADNGIVVHQAGPETLAATIMELAGNRERLAAMSLAARRRALMFSWAEVAKQYLELYQLILAGCRSRGATSEG